MYEQEADRVAADVVQRIHAPAPKTGGEGALQRQEMGEDEEVRLKSQEGSLQRVEISQLNLKSETEKPSEASADLEGAIQGARGSGQPLADTVREPMEREFGADFSGVRVHTDAKSDQLNQSIQAKAFTTGEDIFFRQGAYEPRRKGGQELIAHELTHVVQQKQGNLIQRTIVFKAEGGDDARETEQLVNDFRVFAKGKNKILADLIASAENRKNFDLHFVAQVNPDQIESYQGKTEIEVQTQSGQWINLKEIGGNWVHLPKPANVLMNIKFIFKQGKADDRERQFYTLLHEMIVHAAEYWTLVKKLVLGEKAAMPYDEYGEGGKLHQGTHHKRIVTRDYPPYEELLAEAHSYIMGKEIAEMLELEKHGKPLAGKKWNSDRFTAIAQEDMVTQIVMPILYFADEHFVPLKEAIQEELKEETSQQKKEDAQVLLMKLEPIKEIFVRDQVTLEKLLESGWPIYQGNLKEPVRRIPWENNPAALINESIETIKLYIKDVENLVQLITERGRKSLLRAPIL
jgi:hypothetical protein